jgi:K+-transporting ATPase A subunit
MQIQILQYPRGFGMIIGRFGMVPVMVIAGSMVKKT